MSEKIGEDLTREERETIISFNDGEDVAFVSTTSPFVARKMEKRFRRPPDRQIGRMAEWLVPKKWVTMPRNKEKK